MTSATEGSPMMRKPQVPAAVAAGPLERMQTQQSVKATPQFHEMQ